MTRGSGQLGLPFLPQRSYAEADFVPGAANAEARLWLGRWPAWPAGRLVLWGPEGSGKSHLATLWQRRSGASALTGEALGAMRPEAVPGLLAPGAALLVEDLGAGEQGRPLLHLINAAAEAEATLLLTARTPPSRWPSPLPDLRSRLAATAAVAISLPDERLAAAVLAKLLADRQVTLRPGLLDWLALRTARDFATIQALAATLDASSLAAGGRVTRPVAAAALATALAMTGHAEPPPGSTGGSGATPAEDRPSRREGPLE